MNTPDLIEQFGPYLATFIFSVFSALIPFLNLEIYLAAVSAVAPNSLIYLTAILFIATFGHMIAKGILYGTGRGVLKISVNNSNSKFSTKQIKELQLKMEKSRARNSAFLFFSGVTRIASFLPSGDFGGDSQTQFLELLYLWFRGQIN